MNFKSNRAELEGLIETYARLKYGSSRWVFTLEGTQILNTPIPSNPFNSDNIIILLYDFFINSEVSAHVDLQRGTIDRDIIFDNKLMHNQDMWTMIQWDIAGDMVRVTKSEDFNPGTYTRTSFVQIVDGFIKRPAYPTHQPPTLPVGSANYNAGTAHLYMNGVSYGTVDNVKISVNHPTASKCDCGQRSVGESDDSDVHSSWCKVWQFRKNPNLKS